MLRIVKAFEPIQITNITMCVYALPGIGRTSCGYTADNPILFDFDKGSHRSKNRRGTTLLMDTWEDAKSVQDELLMQHKTVVVDTVGRLLDSMTVTLIKQDAKNANRAGGLSLQGYGALKTTFITWLDRMRSLGLDVLLLSHCDEQKDGDEMRERLDIQGGSKNEVYKVCDSMGRIKLDNRKRMLHFSPSETAFGKNPGQFEPFEVPNYATTPDFLAGIMARTKEAINKLSAEQAEVSALLADWQAKIDAAAKPEDFNALMPLGKDLDERIRENAKRILVKAAKDKEIVFDVKAGGFVGKEAAPANGTAKPANGNGAAAPTAEKPADQATEAKADEAKPAAETKKGKAKKGEQEALPVGEAREPGAEG